MNAKAKKNLYNLAYWFDVVGMILNVLVFLYAIDMMMLNPLFGGVMLVFSLVKYAWYIPMALLTKKSAKQVDTKDEKGHMALGICTFIFCGLVAGSLIMVAANGYLVDTKLSGTTAKKSAKKSK